MNSVALFYPVLPQILLLQPPAWQSKRVLNGRKEIKSYNLFSTNVVWSHLGLGFFWELSNIWQICLCWFRDEIFSLETGSAHQQEKISTFLKNQQSSFFNMKMYFFCGYNICPQDFECWKNQ